MTEETNELGGTGPNEPVEIGRKYAAERDAAMRKVREAHERRLNAASLDRGVMVDNLMASAAEVSPLTTSSVPLNFLPNGVTSVRLYVDAAGEVLNTVPMHQVGSLVARCDPDGSCEIDRHLQWWESKRPRFPDKWRYRSSAKTIIIAFIFSTTASNPNLRIKVPSFLLGPSSMEAEIKKIIRQSAREELMRDFDPGEEAPLWVIRKDNYSLEISRSNTLDSCPTLPHTFPLLQSYKGLDGPPSEDVVKAFKAKIDEAYALHMGYSDPR